ncbi:hypothetical protein FLACOL_00450 [Flavobacterium columnare]|uniref:Shufflon system plasmid conjugative transfer pilus tip adhesin PilV n=2 Tax=Flavobacterium TaxID=237 RepID=A0ABW8PQA5_9FLAO|nr:stathmin family protein [Flavobacterium columnare]SPE76469.1 hypothetical protein FLACOL_00450 [Flavobacterium columnare]
MRISIKFLESVLLGLIASVGYGQQVIDNVGIGLNGPHYGVRQNISSFTGHNGGWARGFHIGEDSDPNNPILMSFGAYGDVRATGAPTLIYGYIGKDWTKTFMTFSPNGNVGVGTNGPNERLHLGKGNFRMDDGDMYVFNYTNRMVGHSDRKNYYIGTYDITGTSGLDLHWYGGIKFGTSVGDVMQIAENGDVGIGTNAPTVKLDVRGDIKFGRIISTSDRMHITGGESLYLLNKGGVIVSEAWGGNGNLSVEGNTVLRGSVGIGTNAPTAKLDVRGDIKFESTISTPNRMHITGGESLYLLNKGGVIVSKSWDGNGNLNVEGNTVLGGSVGINGNVGIGTQTPAEKMEINGGYLRITNSGQEGPALSLYNPDKTEAGAVWRIYNMTGLYSNSLQFWNYPSNFSHGYQRLILHDNGDMNVNGNITLSKDLYASDIVSGGSNSWIFHTPDDGRNTLHIAPRVNNNWEWGKALIVKADGNTAVQGKLEAKEIKVTTTPTADFVFAEDYKLPKLSEVEKHLKEKRHLPEIASAKVMEQEGVNVGEFQIKLLQKIEELTLYVIEQQKQLEIQNKRIQELEKKNRK